MLDELHAVEARDLSRILRKVAAARLARAPSRSTTGLDEGFRREFESIIDGVNAMSTARDRRHPRPSQRPTASSIPTRVSDFCENASCAIRSALNRASDLVNNGRENAADDAPSAWPIASFRASRNELHNLTLGTTCYG